MLPTSTPAAYAVYETIRAVEPPDSPLPGMLARAPDGRPVLLVDREIVADWPGWGADGEPHLLAPLDVVRRADGHDVVVPALAEEVDAFLVRRVDAGAPLSPGEAVTLAVSVLRGLAPSLARAGDIDGAWWLTDDGRPMLVEGIGESTTRAASARVLASIAEALARTRLGAAVHDLAAAVEQAGFGHDVAAWEERLFACAEPEPLVTQVLGPLRARRLAAESPAAPDPTPSRSLWERVAFHADADLAETASDVWTELLRRIRRPRTSRVRPLLWAGVIAAVVIVGGLLWPTGSSDDVVPSAVTTPLATPAGEAAGFAPTTTGPVENPDDAAALTAELLDQRVGCVDTACLATVLEDPARTIAPGVVDAPGPERSVTLLDDLGGLFVSRVDSLKGLPVQLVTVVETERGWRIRDVHDVSDAPS